MLKTASAGIVRNLKQRNRNLHFPVIETFYFKILHLRLAFSDIANLKLNNMRKLFFTFLFLMCATIIFAQSGDKKLALVIGNANYQYGGKLKNPVNDAVLMTKTLQDLGFEVISETDATKSKMDAAILNFSRKLSTYNVALFYYAGHGIQVNGINYLIPVDAKLDDQISISFEAVNVSSVINQFEYYPDNLNIVILDACRDNPFRSWQRGGNRGFKAIPAPSGTIIAFATREGETASDGTGSNGLFTEQLVKQMQKPQSIEQVFKNTRVDVLKESDNSQCPQEWSMFTGDFYFTKSGTDNIVNNTTTETETPVFNPGNIAYGKISFDTEISGDLYLDGKKLGQATAKSKNNILDKITIGNHTLRIGDVEKSITVNENKTTFIKFDLPTQFIDARDRKTYKIVYIGNQVWMAENLAYKANSGCWAYDNNESNVATYGYLYNFETAKNVCPSGWHLPSDEEWKLLEMELGMQQEETNKYEDRGTDEGIKLKSKTGWYDYKNGINERNFSATPGGYMYNDGKFYVEGKVGYWWSRTIGNNSTVAIRRIDYNKNGIYRNCIDKSCGFSVRCIKD